MLRDKDFWERLRQIRLKYGYSDDQTTKELPYSPQPSRHLIKTNTSTYRPALLDKQQKSQPMKYQEEGEQYHLRQAKTATPQPHSSFMHSPPPQRARESFEMAKPLERYKGLNPEASYFQKLGTPSTSPIKKMGDHQSALECSHTVQFSPHKTAMPVLALSPYNKLQNTERQTHCSKNRHPNTERHLSSKDNQWQREQIVRVPQRLVKEEEVKSHLYDHKYSHNIENIDKIQDKINLLLRRTK